MAECDPHETADQEAPAFWHVTPDKFTKVKWQ